jgi:hypothetical protein
MWLVITGVVAFGCGRLVGHAVTAMWDSDDRED